MKAMKNMEEGQIDDWVERTLKYKVLDNSMATI